MKSTFLQRFVLSAALTVSCVNREVTQVESPPYPQISLSSRCARFSRSLLPQDGIYSYNPDIRRIAITGIVALRCPNSENLLRYHLIMNSEVSPAPNITPDQRIQIALTRFSGFDDHTDLSGNGRAIDLTIFAFSRFPPSLPLVRRFLDYVSFDQIPTSASDLTRNDFNPRTLAVLETLGYLDDGREIPFLTNFSNGNWAIFNLAPSLRGEIWNPDVTSNFLIGHLRNNPNPFFRALAAYRLGMLKDERAISVLDEVSRRCVSENHEVVRCIEPQMVRRAAGFAQSRIGGAAFSSLVDFEPYPHYGESSILISRAFAIGNSDFDMDFRQLYFELRERRWPLKTIALVFALKYNSDKDAQLQDLLHSSDLGARIVAGYVCVAVGSYYLIDRETIDEWEAYDSGSPEGMIYPMRTLYRFARID